MSKVGAIVCFALAIIVLIAVLGVFIDFNSKFDKFIKNDTGKNLFKELFPKFSDLKPVALAMVIVCLVCYIFGIISSFLKNPSIKLVACVCVGISLFGHLIAGSLMVSDTKIGNDGKNGFFKVQQDAKDDSSGFERSTDEYKDFVNISLSLRLVQIIGVVLVAILGIVGIFFLMKTRKSA